MADKPYRDPKSTKIEDWKWRPLEQIKAELAMREIPDYIQEGFGGFMNEQAGRAKKGAMTPRDLIKAYTIAQSSIGRGGLSHSTASKMGMKLPNTGGEVRPEGAFAEWLGSPEGQRYLDLAQKGEVDPAVIADLQYKFAPFGKQNDQAAKMADAARTMPSMAGELNRVLVGSPEEYRDFAEKLKGIAGAKSGFIGSLLGRGDLPTLDARQLNLHTEGAPVGVNSIMNRGKGKGAREAVDRLAARQTAMGLDIDPALAAHYQHLAHHAVWDKTAGAKTTHEDLIRAMRGYAKGGAAEDEAERTFPLDLPKAPVPSTQEMQAIVDRVARQQAGEHVRKPNDTQNLAGRSMRESARVQQVPYGLRPTKALRPTPVYSAQKGDINVVVPGDQTVSDMMLEHVAGVPINSQQEGGSRYGEGKLHIPKAKRPFWASGPGPAQAFQNKVTRLAALTGEDPRIIAHHLAMGNDANNFAMHLVDANLKAIHGKGVKPESMEAFNRVVQAGSKSTGPFPHFPGVHNPEEAYEAMLKDPEMRKFFNDRMKTPNITQPLGLPNGLDIDWAISHPELRNMEINMTGHSVGRMRPGAELIPGSEHNTYSHDIAGESLGRAPELAPMELAFLDATHYIKPRLSAPRHYTKTMQGSAPHQVVDERYLNMMNDYYHKLRQTRGFADGGHAEGGEVKTEGSSMDYPSQDEMLAHLILRKADGGPINIKNVGAEEAPNMPVKEYTQSAGDNGLAVGGVDFQPENPGKQLMPGAPNQPPGQVPGAPQQMPQQPAPLTGQPTPSLGGPQAPMLNQPNKMLGGPPMPPFGQPRGPQSNILAMTPQGQAMQAMRPSPMQMPNKVPMPRMASGGAVRMAGGGASGATSQKGPIGIDALGDSTTYGWNHGQQSANNMINTAQSLFGDKVKINNMGIPSTTLGDLLSSNAFRDVLTNNNPIVILNYGMNEAYRAADPTTASGNDPESFRANLMSAIQQLQDAGKKVILQTPNNTNSTDGWQGNVGTYANIISDVANQTGVALNDKYNTPITYAEDDTIHPDDAGYGVLGQNLYSTINSYLTPTTQNASTSATDTTAAKPMSVEDLYYKVLGRAPDAEGLAYWKQQFGNEVDPSEASVFTGTAQNLVNQDPTTYASLAPNLTVQQMPQTAATALPVATDAGINTANSYAGGSPLDAISNDPNLDNLQQQSQVYQPPQDIAQQSVQPMQYADVAQIPEPAAAPRSLRMQSKFENPSLAYQPEQYMFAKGGSITPSVAAMRHALAKKRATTHGIQIEERPL